MKQYKIIDVDYTNCHPVIADALKQGKHIWCYYPHNHEGSVEPVLITGYSDNKEDKVFPYMGIDINSSNSEFCRFDKSMLPVEVKKKFKSAASIIQLCIDHGWVPAADSKYLFKDSNGVCVLSTNLIKFYAGKEYKPEEIHAMYVHPDWLEEV